MANSIFVDAIVKLHRQARALNPRQRLILVGDHNQLRPISGRLLHEAESFSTFVVYQLPRIVRQATDTPHGSAIEDMGKGEPVSDATVAHVEQIASGSPDASESGAFVLHAATTKNEVHELNARALRALPGNTKVYTAVDTGPIVNRLTQTNLEATLCLKVGAHVMITLNLDVRGGLVNGTMACVTALNDDSVVVKLGSGREVCLERKKCEVVDAVENRVVATREQIPLTLAWAVTVYKLQSLTMRDRYHVDLSQWGYWSDADKRALLYVALSRAADAALVSICLPTHEGRTRKASKWTSEALRRFLDAGLDQRRALTTNLRERNVLALAS